MIISLPSEVFESKYSKIADVVSKITFNDKMRLSNSES